MFASCSPIVKHATETLYSPPKRNLTDLTTYTIGQGSDSAREQNSSAGEDARSSTRAVADRMMKSDLEIDVMHPRLLSQPCGFLSRLTGFFWAQWRFWLWDLLFKVINSALWMVQRSEMWTSKNLDLIFIHLNVSHFSTVLASVLAQTCLL